MTMAGVEGKLKSRQKKARIVGKPPIKNDILTLSSRR